MNYESKKYFNLWIFKILLNHINKNNVGKNISFFLPYIKL